MHVHFGGKFEFRREGFGGKAHPWRFLEGNTNQISFGGKFLNHVGQQLTNRTPPFLEGNSNFGGTAHPVKKKHYSQRLKGHFSS